MKQIVGLIALLLLSPAARAGTTLEEARKEWLEGNYKEAQSLYEALAKDAKTRLAATLGWSLALESKGEYERAQAVVEALVKETPKDARLLARLADLHFTRGRWLEAEKLATAALDASKDSFLAHWVLGQVYRDRGNLDKAEEQFVWFIRASNAREITDPDEMRLAGLAGIERARYKHLNDEYQSAVNGYFLQASKIDKLYWLGDYEAGRVFMDKHNKPAAFRAFERALTVNPLAAEVLVCKGQMAAAHMEFKDAEKYATQALKINPRFVPALNLMAEVHWFSDETAETLKLVEKARAVNPRDEATLARLAACCFAQNRIKDFDGIVAEARANNPKCYTFYTDLASLMEQRKFNAEAERYYRVAMEMQPKFAEAPTGLGLIYMRNAKEAEARKILELANEADPFNVRVDNSLKVLAHLERYASKQTKHFIIRFDQKNDEVLANYMASYLEKIYDDLAEQFDYHPAGPFQIQIFNQHQMFSGRIVAVPDLHTIGACTGPLVAMVSPRDTSGVIAKPFNWNRVIRHELVHVFNLQQTAGRVPHWFTEGLAVRYEGPNIPPSWHALLAEKYHEKDLLNLDNILLGFVRPRSPLQWQQAYLQSLLYVKYLTKAHGEKSIGKMLAAFAEGLDTGPALEKACNVKKDVFEKGYLEFLGGQVKNTPVPRNQKNLTLKQLRDAYAKMPDDLDLAAQLAEANYKLGKKRDAKELADKVITKDPKHPLAVYVKALILMDENKTDTAYSLLDSVNTDELKDARPLKLLAKLQYNQKKYPQAARTVERARKIEPHEQAWIAELAKIYTKTEQKDKLLEIYAEVARIDPDDLISRKRLAKHYLEKKDNAEAEKYARMGLEIDVLDRDCQSVIIQALEAQNKNDEADRLKKLLNQ